MSKFIKTCGVLFSLAFIAAHFFVSCASSSVSAAPNTPAVFVTNLKKVHLLTADKISKSIDEVQLFEGTIGDRTVSMPLYIQADEKGLSVSVLNDFGTSMGDLSYNSSNEVSFSSVLFPEDVKAEYIVWDIQLAFYQAEEIAGCLAKHKLIFSVESGDDVEVRKILDGTELIEEITLRKNYVGIKNYLRGYEYHLIGVGDE